MSRPLSLLALANLLSTTLAHSWISYININGDHYYGYDPRPEGINPAHRVAWTYNAPDQGWVNGTHYQTPDIACHRDATSVEAHAVVRAGDNVGVHWNHWPFGHKGPVLSYLAPCVGTTDGCYSVDKTQLTWTKIDDSAPGLIDKSPRPDGEWASDWLTTVKGNNHTWQVHVPSGLQPGPYVLRHEIISLHFGQVPAEGGAQHYPVCINLFVLPPAEGTPTLPFALNEVANGDLYQTGHPGLFYDIYAQPMADYVIPGPTQAANAEPVRYDQQFDGVYVRDGVPVRVQGTGTVPWVAKRTAEVFRA